jgi:protein-S-isoprenylcysteine O-methyltransferase Ste14
MKWKWENVPIPEPHLIGFLIGIVISVFRKSAIFGQAWIGHLLGWPLILGGILIAGWAVLEAKQMSVEHPTRILDSGPYAFTRNPMYLGWTIGFLGITLVMNSVWFLMLFPLVVVYTDRFVIRREEEALERTFGSEYRKYRERVRRYM